MSKAGTAKRCCALLFVAALLAAGGLLAWRKLAPEESKSQGGAGLFNIFGDQNSTTVTTIAPTTMEPIPTASPSSLPTIYRYPFHQCDSDAKCCNGLENLCDWPVNEILFGGVHNAMATADKFIVPNQLRPMKEALQAGFRAINLDVCRCQGKWNFCHGLCGLGKANATELLTQLSTFLDQNKNEIVILTLELNSEAGQPVNLTDFYTDVMSNIDGLTDRLYFHENPTDPWPTLGNLIDMDERLITFHWNGPNCTQPDECPRGLHWYWQFAQETGFDFGSIEEILDADTSCLISRGATTTTGAFLGVNNFVTSKSFDMESQLMDAETTNFLDFANQRIQKCSDIIQYGPMPYYGEGDVNLLFVDFWHVGDIIEVVQEYNRKLGYKSVD